AALPGAPRRRRNSAVRHGTAETGLVKLTVFRKCRVTEGMWKARPVIASAVGGILGQIEGGTSGLLLRDPCDLAAFGRLLREVLTDKDLAARLGQQARRRVQEHFLVNRHLSQYLRLLEKLMR